jgi:EpsI family protein
MRRVLWRALLPAAVFLAGTVGKGAARSESSLALSHPLHEFPTMVSGFTATGDRQLDDAVLRTLRPDDYMHRSYEDASGRQLALFIAYYARQLGGSTIHSPRNCLPGSGWEPVRHQRLVVSTPYGDGTVNRYLVEHESGARALVFYWYQGRGRVEANEYMVKRDLVRDALLKRRSDEALVRIVFPVAPRGDVPPASGLTIVEEVVHRLHPHLPG